MDVLRLSPPARPARDIVIVDQPTRRTTRCTEEQALAQALRNRPELAAQRVTIKINDLQRRVARNRTLPDLTPERERRTRRVRPALLAGASRRRVTGRHPVWGIGLQFSYPIGNHVAENDYIKSRLTLEQAQTQLQSLEAGIANDVKAVIRLLASSYKQIDVTSRGRAYAEERLRAFREEERGGTRHHQGRLRCGERPGDREGEPDPGGGGLQQRHHPALAGNRGDPGPARGSRSARTPGGPAL